MLKVQIIYTDKAGGGSSSIEKAYTTHVKDGIYWVNAFNDESFGYPVKSIKKITEIKLA